MKKYKVLKPYPGSENLGEKIEEWTIPYNIRYDPLFSQYYEEIVEKDYEILSFKDLIGTLIIKKGGRFLTLFHETEYKEKELIKSCNIHSIKRLLDGELFTLDDVIQSKVTSPYNNDYPHHKQKRLIITGFDFKNDLIVNVKTVDDDKFYGKTILLKNIIHVKKPLFTTEDRVNMFEGDEYWNVNVLFNIKHIPNCYNFRTEKEYVLFNSLNNNNCFSTRTAAEEYVLMNKPCLSINNVMSVTYNPTESKTSTTYKLIKLVQKSMENGKD